ncbi:MAG: homoserine kinase [Candidatus Heimdallarchaeota archaeon]|nr:homoserine kinase [Candidatus Heimdallarchaeota archaeon]
MKKSTAFAPATMANLAVGFDMLGCAIPILGDTVTVETIDSGVEFRNIISEVELPVDPVKNSASYPLVRLLEDRKLDCGLAIDIVKGIPMASGLGGSAASAVASVVAANAVLELGLSKKEMLYYALLGESVASGSLHADNVVPALYGGLTLSLDTHGDVNTMDVIQLPIPEGYFLLIHPHMQIRTEDARDILQHSVDLKTHTMQSMHLAGWISSLYTGNKYIFNKYFKDHIIETQRKQLIPGFDTIQHACREHDVQIFSISGAGPTLFAWHEDPTRLEGLQSHLLDMNLPNKFDSWITQISVEGARII